MKLQKWTIKQVLFERAIYGGCPILIYEFDSGKEDDLALMNFIIESLEKESPELKFFKIDRKLRGFLQIYIEGTREWLKSNNINHNPNSITISEIFNHKYYPIKGTLQYIDHYNVKRKHYIMGLNISKERILL